MCETCTVEIARLIGEFLEVEEVPTELAFTALHLLARMIELRTGMSAQEAISFQQKGQELGERILQSMEQFPAKEDDLSLVVAQPPHEKPN